jgi:5-methylcytosine-specific restriction endonuclease McrA
LVSSFNVTRALVLNATYEPLGIVSARRALVLVLSEKAEMLHSADSMIHSATLSFPEPSVVKLAYCVKVPRVRRMALNRRAVFMRDAFRCQYCGAAAENIDHVVPRSRGGAHSWENVVASCRRCNSCKEDRLPHEAGFSLARRPVQPNWIDFLLVAAVGVRPDWQVYLAANSMTA